MLETIRRYGVRHPQVLAAMAAQDRAQFVPERWKQLAYDDRPLPIGFGQTISQPYTVARMIELLAAGPTGRLKNSKVLEIGTGSGYQAAVLSRLFGQVYSIEKVKDLAHKALEVIKKLGIGNVMIKVGDGKKGWRKHAPYQAIIVAADARQIPPQLLAQLAQEGRLVVPIQGELVRLTKVGEKVKRENFGRYSFVPLV